MRLEHFTKQKVLKKQDVRVRIKEVGFRGEMLSENSPCT